MGHQRERRAQHKMIFTSSLSLLSPLVCSLLVARAQAGNIAEELILAGSTTLADLVVKAGLADTLSNSGPFTVFAPDNEAFNKVPESILEALGSDVELLKKVLDLRPCSSNPTVGPSLRSGRGTTMIGTASTGQCLTPPARDRSGTRGTTWAPAIALPTRLKRASPGADTGTVLEISSARDARPHNLKTPFFS